MIKKETRARLVRGEHVGSLGSKRCPLCSVNQWRHEYVVVSNHYKLGWRVEVDTGGLGELVSDDEAAWHEMKVMHLSCYLDAGQPYGPAGSEDDIERASTPKNMPWRRRMDKPKNSPEINPESPEEATG